MLSASLLLVTIFFSLVAMNLAGTDFYKVLGVARNASEKEIRTAYKKLAIQYHPDKNKGNPEVASKMQAVNAAYTVLSDAEKRRIFDQHGEEGLNKDNRGGGGGWGDMFDMFGRRQGGKAEMKKAQPTHIELQATLEDLYNGRDFEVLQRRQVLCSHCRGTGADDPNDVSKCPVCSGSGVKIVNQQLAPGFVQRVQTTCDHCGGKGKIMNSQCHVCHGSKVQKGEQFVIIFIEKGMPDGHEIVSPSDGDQNPDEEPGDLIFKIKTRTHKVFTRQGNDLLLTARITLLQALVGFTAEFQHLDGRTVTLTRTAVTPPGFVQTIDGEGMPIYEHSSKKGKLHVTYQINFPSHLTEQQKTEFKRLLVK